MERLGLESFDKIWNLIDKHKNIFSHITKPYVIYKLRNNEVLYQNGLYLIIRIFEKDLIFYDVPVKEGECQASQCIVEEPGKRNTDIIELNFYKNIAITNWYAITHKWNKYPNRRLISMGYKIVHDYHNAYIWKLEKEKLLSWFKEI